MKRYIFTYTFDNQRFQQEIIASSQGEAVQRIRAMAYAEYTGEVMHTGSFSLSWWRDWFGR